MKKIGLALTGALLMSTSAYADNIADCEIVVQKEIVMEPNMKNSAEIETEMSEEKTAMIATYLPASDFIFSVFDTEPGHLETIDDNKIRALMCTRSSVLPTEFDLKLIETGVPFFLSRDFDAADSAFMAIQQKGGVFKYDYSGPDLSKTDIEILKTQLKSIEAIVEKETVKDMENEKSVLAKKTVMAAEETAREKPKNGTE